MARRVFYSFYYKPDNWRASQVRNMGVIEGNRPATDNDWEKITTGEDKDEKIEKWIAEQMDGKSCVVVLIGSNTANRKWINREIKKAWDDEKGVLGVYVHNVKNSDGEQSTKGSNPFASIKDGESGKMLSSIVKAHDPPFSTSKKVYDYIKENLADWVEEAITIRSDNWCDSRGERQRRKHRRPDLAIKRAHDGFGGAVVPQGRCDNSPAIHRWGRGHPNDPKSRRDG